LERGDDKKSIILIGLVSKKSSKIRRNAMQTRELMSIEKEIEERNFKTSEEFHKFLDEKFQKGEVRRFIGDKEIFPKLQ
jgi:hypothetical protein